jgi:hypothetical protein
MPCRCSTSRLGQLLNLIRQVTLFPQAWQKIIRNPCRANSATTAQQFENKDIGQNNRKRDKIFQNRPGEHCRA